MGLFRYIFGKRRTLQEQLQIFAELGYKLAPNITLEDLRQYPDWKIDYKIDPFGFFYQALGLTTEKKPRKPISNQCWNFDVEAIEDHGSYVEILSNISRITGGALTFQNLQDYVDFDEEVAWVSFDFNNQSYKWNLKINDDWVDGEVFTKVMALNETIKSGRKFTYYSSGGQNCVISYSTPEELTAFNKVTGLGVKWLDPKKYF